MPGVVVVLCGQDVLQLALHDRLIEAHALDYPKFPHRGVKGPFRLNLREDASRTNLKHVSVSPEAEGGRRSLRAGSRLKFGGL